MNSNAQKRKRRAPFKKGDAFVLVFGVLSALTLLALLLLPFFEIAWIHQGPPEDSKAPFLVAPYLYPAMAAFWFTYFPCYLIAFIATVYACIQRKTSNAMLSLGVSVLGATFGFALPFYYNFVLWASITSCVLAGLLLLFEGLMMFLTMKRND